MNSSFIKSLNFCIVATLAQSFSVFQHNFKGVRRMCSNLLNLPTVFYDIGHASKAADCMLHSISVEENHVLTVSGIVLYFITSSFTSAVQLYFIAPRHIFHFYQFDSFLDDSDPFGFRTSFGISASSLCDRCHSFFLFFFRLAPSF